MLPVETWIDPSAIAPHPQNYNQHPPAQVAEIAASLRQYEQTKAIVCWRGLIIAGEGLWLGAQHAQRSQVKIVDFGEVWSEAQALSYILDDNEISKGSIPNNVKMAALIAQVKAAEQKPVAIDDKRITEIMKAGKSEARPELPTSGKPSVEAKPVSETDRYPLAIILDLNEYRKWQALKTELDTASDKAVLLSLMESYNDRR